MLVVVPMENFFGRLLSFCKLRKKNKVFTTKNLLVRKSIEIKKHNSFFNGSNELVIDTNAWGPILKELK